MGAITDATLRLIARNGRAMTLRRRQAVTTTFTDVATRGVLLAYSPDEITGGVIQGDARVIVEAPAIVAAFTAPLKGDYLVIDGKAWLVQGAHARNVAGTVAAFEVWVRGGAN
jgi:hypothetical protein